MRDPVKPVERSAPVRRTKPAGKALQLVGRLALPVSVLLVGLVLLFIFGIEPNRVVATVILADGKPVKVTMRAFHQRLDLERTRVINSQKQDAAGAKPIPADFGPDYRPVATLGFAASVIDRLVREVLIKDEAARRGLSASDDEIDLVIERTLGLIVWPKDIAPPASSSASTWLKIRPQLLAEMRTKRAESKHRLAQIGFPKEYREIVRLEILEEGLRNQFVDEISVHQDRVLLKLIRAETEISAAMCIAALDAGESFDALFTRAGRGAISGASAMERDWSSRIELDRDYNREFGAAVMCLRAGEIVRTPLPAVQGLYFVKVAGHENRTMSEDWRRQRGIDAMQTWFAQQYTRIKQNPEWMEHVPPTPHIPNRGYVGELPPRGAGLVENRAAPGTVGTRARRTNEGTLNSSAPQRTASVTGGEDGRAPTAQNQPPYAPSMFSPLEHPQNLGANAVGGIAGPLPFASQQGSR